MRDSRARSNAKDVAQSKSGAGETPLIASVLHIEVFLTTGWCSLGPQPSAMQGDPNSPDALQTGSPMKVGTEARSPRSHVTKAQHIFPTLKQAQMDEPAV